MLRKRTHFPYCIFWRFYVNQSLQIICRYFWFREDSAAAKENFGTKQVSTAHANTFFLYGFKRLIRGEVVKPDLFRYLHAAHQHVYMERLCNKPVFGETPCYFFYSINTTVNWFQFWSLVSWGPGNIVLPVPPPPSPAINHDLPVLKSPTVWSQLQGHRLSLALIWKPEMNNTSWIKLCWIST